jgi:hypothetical protein
VKTSPEALGKDVLSGDLVTSDAQVQAWGEIKGAGSLADFARLKITPDEAKALSATDALNLTTAEAAALKAAKGPEAVTASLQKMLLARYQAYKASGLAGIPAYDRGGGKTTDHGADLRRATEASAGLKKYAPAFHGMLLGYPKVTVPKAQESFFWVKSMIEGFGGSMKRSIGSGIMAKKMKEIFAAGRTKVAS